MVWVLEWHQPGQNEVHITLWHSEIDALKTACSEILSTISDDWDLDDPDSKDKARQINDLVAAGDFESAVSRWSDFESDSDNYEYCQYWNVYERVPASCTNQPILLIIDDDTVDTDDDIDNEDMVEIIDTAYKASSPGATCRGPCKNKNEYAYADRIDGTHVCYQCQMFSDVFGRPIK